ncbi:MAG: TIGR01777 family oxidoreductase [Solirubrobacteraceae bacterium]
MKILVTGATGLIGRALVAELRARGHELTVLSRDPQRAQAELAVPALAWNATHEPAPVSALEGVEAIAHLAGAPIAQRWSDQSKREIRESRVAGTRNLIAGIESASKRPAALVSSSAIGIYGARHEEPLDEDAPVGHGFLAEVCAAWEAEANRASSLGARVATIRTGVVLDAAGGALDKMLPPFRLGVGGPVAGGEQYVSWVHKDDVVGIFASALEQQSWSGPINATAPAPVTNRELSHELGRALHRPAALPIPGFALKLLYGEMSEVVTTGQRVLPAKALVLGYEFRHAQLGEALRAALG